MKKFLSLFITLSFLAGSMGMATIANATTTHKSVKHAKKSTKKTRTSTKKSGVKKSTKK